MPAGTRLGRTKATITIEPGVCLHHCFDPPGEEGDRSLTIAELSTSWPYHRARQVSKLTCTSRAQLGAPTPFEVS
jgi:hypothetical protein